MTKKKPSRKLNVYANLAQNRKVKKDQKARKRAEYLATLPKHPVKRFFYRMHPKRVLKYWFSLRGFVMTLKIVGVFALIGILSVGALFAYYRRELDAIRPSELAKRVQTTVTRYYDRNNKLLWEDKGTGNYKLVVKSDQISKVAKDATIAIEDRDFYDHHGVSPEGITRAAVNNFKGGSTQGGSTLTQQLVKQVFFAEEAHERGFAGIPRKIKEMILSIEVERMYDKDQILTLYLNESPYGGRRNGIESGAQTYFGKNAKDLNLAEASLLAGVPNQPGLYDPYNTEGHSALIKRQHKVLDAMVETGKITQKEANEAKKVDILKKIKPQVNTKEDIKAPHFVLEVRNQLETELGRATVGRGGLTVKTTLDLKAQQEAEKAIATGAQMLPSFGADNLALSAVDVKTGNVIAMVGSVDYNKPKYGERNAATSLLEPGSSIKPIVDYTPLFKEREGVNYAPGSILSDENIDKIYCQGSPQPCTVQNYTRQTYGNIPIRKSLAGSLNRPAVKAMYINGIKDSIKTAQDLGDKSYCVNNVNAGLSSAIGGGCTVKQIEHTNAFASLARGGTYKPISYILEVKNTSGEVLKKWTDPKPKKVIDPQTAYMISDILTDPEARKITFGGQAYSYGFEVPGVWTAGKTGTTENGEGQAKDSWFMNYSPVIASGVWMGNHDGRPLSTSDNSVVRRVEHDFMEAVHKNVYQPAGKWNPGDEIPRPQGIQTLTINGITDIYPSWFNKSAGRIQEELVFDKLSRKRATDCTPEAAKVKIAVTKLTDPVTKKPVFFAPDGYEPSKKDDLHKCGDKKPSIVSISVTPTSEPDIYQISVEGRRGSHRLSGIRISVDGTSLGEFPISGSGSVTTKTRIENPTSIQASIEDAALYSGSGSRNFTPPSSPPSSSSGSTP